jgi:hypothetical protein
VALFRRIVEDSEARLAPPGAAAGAGGKAEHQRFADGEVRFEVRGRGLELAEGAELEIRLNGAVVGRASVARGRFSLRLSRRRGDPIPEVRAGDGLEIRHRAVVVLEGSFRPD